MTPAEEYRRDLRIKQIVAENMAVDKLFPKCVALIIQDYLARPREISGRCCVVCARERKNSTRNLCIKHWNICVMCHGDCGEYSRSLLCTKCWNPAAYKQAVKDAAHGRLRGPMPEDLSWVYGNRDYVYNDWHNAIFESDLERYEQVRIKREKEEAIKQKVRLWVFQLAEAMKPRDQLIDELKNKLWAANAAINEMRETYIASRRQPTTDISRRPEPPFY